MFASISTLRNPFIFVITLPLIWGTFFNSEAIVSAYSIPSTCELAVLADKQDQYYPLAEEIAATENAPLFNGLNEVFACQPDHLVWVTSPGRLSDQAMVAVGLALRESDSAPTVGIITGSTLEQAKALWARGQAPVGTDFFAVNAASQAAHIPEGRIVKLSPEVSPPQSLTRQSLVDTLKEADYLTFTGHGSSGYLGLDENTRLQSADIPTLPPVIISTGSCQTLRPWNENSISLRFVDQGAAAYAGFVYSPNEGFMIGEFDQLPYQYTWKEFAIGDVVKLQNRGTMQGFANFPYLFLLGDPRIAFQTDAPYQLAEDREEGEKRILRYSGAPKGLVPVRINNGAGYSFVSVPGVTSAADADPFYNSELQMENHNGDKYLLLIQPGGDLTVELSRVPAWYWFPVDMLLDSLDYSLILAQQNGEYILALIFAIFPLAWVIRAMIKKRLGWNRILIPAAIGVGAALIKGIYVWIRIQQITITSKTVVISPLCLATTFLLVTLGAVIYFNTHSWKGRVVGLAVSTFFIWMPMIFLLATTVGFNLFVSTPSIGVGLYNYALAEMAGISFGVILPLLYFLFRFVKQRVIKP